MKKVGFIGACDKTNIILCVAKILSYTGNKVLVVDATFLQKSRYIIPAINSTKSYITNFEKIDFAVGYDNMRELTESFRIKQEFEYDYVLIDVDSARGIENFEISDEDTNYFVTTFDMYSLKKGMMILKNMPERLNLTKIIYNYKTKSEDENYLNYLSVETKAIWKDYTIYVDKENLNEQILEENQRTQKIKIKRLGAKYQESMLYIVQDILKDKNINDIRKSIKE